MALTVSSVGNATSTTSNTTLASGATVNASVGDVLLICIAAENSGTSGAARTVTITDNASGTTNVYTQRGTTGNATAGTAGDGASQFFFECPVTTALSSNTVTVTFSGNVTHKAMEILRLQPASGQYIRFVEVGTASNTTPNTGATSHSASTVSVANTHTIFCMAAVETDDTITGDSDTTNGSWSTLVRRLADAGADAVTMSCATQYKTVNATGNQSWEATTVSARDSSRNYIVYSDDLKLAEDSVAWSFGVTDVTLDIADFDPSAVSGLQFWARSDQGITKDGSDLVSQWNDISGNARHLTEATNKPLWVDTLINGYPAIRFDGSNDVLTSTSFSLSQPMTVFIVCKIVTHTNLDGIWFGNAGSAPGIFMRSSPSVVIHDTSTGSEISRNSTAAYELFKAIFNGTSSTLAVNNGSDAATGSSYTSSLTAGFAVGSWGAAAGSRFGNIEVAEIAIYNSAITGANLTALNAYFGSRYGIFGNKDLSLASVAWTWAATDASLEFGREIVPAVVGWSWSATNVSLELGREVVPDTLAWSWAAQDVSLEHGWEIVPAPLAWSWAATATSLELGREIVPEGVAWAWAATDAAYRYGYRAVLDGVAWSWAAQDVSLEHGWKISPEGVAWSWAATDVTLVLDVNLFIAPESVAWTWAAQDASLEHGREIGAATVSWSWNVDDATFTLGTIVTDVIKYPTIGNGVGVSVSIRMGTR